MRPLVISILKNIKFNFNKVCFLPLLLLFANFDVAAQSSNPFDLDGNSSQTLESNKPNNKNVFELDDRVITHKKESNPFEINRFQTTDSEENENAIKNHIPPPNNLKEGTKSNNNPFDLSENLSSKKKVKKQGIKNQKNKEQIKKIKNFDTGNNDFLLWVFLFVLILIALLMTTNRQLVLKIFKTVWFYNLTNILFRNFGNREMLFYGLIYINFIVNLGLYFYLSINHYYAYNGVFIFIMSLSLVFVVYTIKHLGLYVFNLIFPNLKKIKIYSFTTTIFNISLGISLIPVNILIAYGVPILVKIALVLGAIIIVAFYLLRLLRGFLITIDYYNYNKFHYFLYLCALEFVPVLFLYKFVLNFL